MKNFLINPQNFVGKFADEKTQKIYKNTMSFLEDKGQSRIKEESRKAIFYNDFIKFLGKEQAFATFLTPSGYGDTDSRYDLSRICPYNEVLAFYGITFQYAYQVSILGLGPIWMSNNESIKHKTAELLKEGGIFAFALSEKEHGADVYSNEMALTANDDGTYTANGGKYYIGNANKAPLVTVQGKYAATGEFVFFVVDSQNRHYRLNEQIYLPTGGEMFVGDFDVVEYPITEADILSSGEAAWDAIFSAINIGKFQLGFASIGCCTHALYFALNHAHNRILYGHPVTDFPHIRGYFNEAYVRLIAMKLYSMRALDYFRSANEKDRRYLLFNPIVKMKACGQGEEVIELLKEVVTAKGLEQREFFSSAMTEVNTLPRLEGTTHVNLAQIIKFMPNYLFNPVEYPEIGTRNDPRDDSYLFHQKAGKASSVTFPDYTKAYVGVNLPNVKIFQAKLELFRDYMTKAGLTAQQQKSLDFMLHLGEMFSSIAYAQLILENAKILQVSDLIVDRIFAFLVSDFSEFALCHLSKHENTPVQVEILEKMILSTPIVNPVKEAELWQEYLLPLVGIYQES